MAWLENWVQRIVAFYDAPMRAQDTLHEGSPSANDPMSHLYRFR